MNEVLLLEEHHDNETWKGNTGSHKRHESNANETSLKDETKYDNNHCGSSNTWSPIKDILHCKSSTSDDASLKESSPSKGTKKISFQTESLNSSLTSVLNPSETFPTSNHRDNEEVDGQPDVIPSSSAHRLFLNDNDSDEDSSALSFKSRLSVRGSSYSDDTKVDDEYSITDSTKRSSRTASV